MRFADHTVINLKRDFKYSAIKMLALVNIQKSQMKKNNNNKYSN